MNASNTIVSGIRSTGNLHIGNYFGVVKNYVQMQHEYNCFFFIADYHTLTTHPNPEDLRRNVRTVLAEYIACGLDPEKCTIYVQSDVPQVAELYLLLNMSAYVGELERCTTFKDKVRQNPDNVNAGLLTYPVLMAADILLHRATKVPIGKDQEQHLEMARNFANRFNHLYKTDFLPEPHAFNYAKELVKIPGLDGSGKMGKSEGEGNAIFLADTEDVIRKKVMRAVSDSGPTIPNQEKPDSIKNLFTIMELVSPTDTLTHFEHQYQNCTIRYGDLKKQLAQDMITFLQPIRQKIQQIQLDNTMLDNYMKIGKEKAQQSANDTIKIARQLVGFK